MRVNSRHSQDSHWYSIAVSMYGKVCISLVSSWIGKSLYTNKKSYL